MSNEIKPITPEEVTKLKRNNFPPKVIETWNNLIAMEFSGNSATIQQIDAAKALAVAMNTSKQNVFDKHWLDIEEIYDEAGWSVIYDQPGYNESCEATFTFKKKTK